MASNLLDAQIQGNPDLPFELKFFVYTDDKGDGKLIDFTSRCTYRKYVGTGMRGYNAVGNSLLDLSPVVVSGELLEGQYNTRGLSLKVDNTDYFWNDAVSNIARYSIVDVTGAAVAASDFASTLDWEGNLCYVAKEYVLQGPTGPVPETEILSYFFIDRIQLGKQDDPAATITIVPLSQPLVEMEAKTVLNGQIPYRGRDITFMVRKLLEVQHTPAELDTFNLSGQIRILNQVLSNPSDATDRRALSSSYRVPHQNSNFDWLDPEFNEFYCRVLLHDNMLDIYDDVAVGDLVNTGDVVAYYKMNTGSGSSLVDEKGTYNGTISGAAWGTGFSGFDGCLDFDSGGNDTVSLGDVTALNSASTFTIRFWANIETTIGYVIRKYLDANNYLQISVASPTSKTIRFGFNNAGTSSYGQLDGSDYVNDNEWHEYCFVYDGGETGNANRLKFYLDGMPISDISFSLTIPATTANLAGASLYIGYTATSFEGSIDNLIIYNTALTAAEVARGYAAYKTTIYIYAGVDEELYRLDAENNTWELLTDGDASDLGIGWNVFRLWYNPNDGKVYGAALDLGFFVDELKLFAYDNSSGFSLLAPTDADGSLDGSGSVFPYDSRTSSRVGYYHSGNDAGLGRITDTGISKTYVGGENVVLPFDQKIYLNQSNITNEAATITTSVNAASPGDLLDTPTDTLTAGYWPFASKGTGGPGIISHLGQNGFLVFDPSENAILYPCRNENSSLLYADLPSEWYLYKYDISTDTCSKVLDIKDNGGAGNWIQPSCGCVDKRGNAYIGCMRWIDSGAVTSESSIHKVDISAATITEIYDSAADTDSVYYTPLSMEMRNSADGFAVTVLKRDSLGESDMYGVASHGITSDDQFANMRELSYDPRGLHKPPNTVAVGEMVYIEETTGKLKQISTTPVDLDSQNNIGDTEFNLLSNVVSVFDGDTASVDYYMVSAPGYPNEFLETPLAGAYALVKFSSYLFSNRKLYDFQRPNQLKVWGAIGQLAQFCSYLTGYGRDKLFYFIRRPTTGTPSIVFSNDFRDGYSDKMIDWIRPDRGRTELYNICSVIPYRTTIQPINIEVTLGDGSAWADNDITASSQLLSPFSILLRAINNANQFEFKPSYTQMTVLLSADEAAASTVLNVSAEAFTLDTYIEADDEVAVPDTDGNTVLRTISTVSATDQTITIGGGGLPAALKQGDEITVIKANTDSWETMSSTIGTSYTEITSTNTSTGVYIKVNNTSTFFSRGDTIQVKSDGLQLKKAPESVQVTTDTNSVKAYKRRPYKKVDNRFFDKRFAKNFANSVVKDFSYMKWTGEMRAVVVYSLTIGDVIRIHDRDIFRAEPGNYIDAYIRAIVYEPKTNYCIYSFRGLNARTL